MSNEYIRVEVPLKSIDFLRQALRTARSPKVPFNPDNVVMLMDAYEARTKLIEVCLKLTEIMGTLPCDRVNLATIEFLSKEGKTL